MVASAYEVLWSEASKVAPIEAAAPLAMSAIPSCDASYQIAAKRKLPSGVEVEIKV